MPEATNHYAQVSEAAKTWQVFHNGELLLESDQALELREHYQQQALPVVVYFPSLLNLNVTKTNHTTHCPIKGDASYWTLGDAENAIWSYQNPMPQVAAIKGYYGFMQSQGFEINSR